MFETRPPRYREGQFVVATVDLYNDGSHPDVPADHLLIPAGGHGEVVQVGHHAEADAPIYMVDYGLTVIGCLEDELAPELSSPGVAADAAVPGGSDGRP